jgi:hypothetical protein
MGLRRFVPHNFLLQAPAKPVYGAALSRVICSQSFQFKEQVNNPLRISLGARLEDSKSDGFSFVAIIRDFVEGSLQEVLLVHELLTKCNNALSIGFDEFPWGRLAAKFAP